MTDTQARALVELVVEAAVKKVEKLTDPLVLAKVMPSLSTPLTTAMLLSEVAKA